MSDFKTKLAYSVLTADLGHVLHVLDQRILHDTKGKISLYRYLPHDEFESLRFYAPAPKSTRDKNGYRAHDKQIAEAWRKFKKAWDRGQTYDQAVECACEDATFGNKENDAATILIDAIENGNSRVRGILKATDEWQPKSYFKESNRRRARH